MIDKTTAEKLHRAELANVLKKLQDGKTLTKSERELIDAETQPERKGKEKLSPAALKQKLIENLKSRLDRGQRISAKEAQILREFVSNQGSGGSDAEWVDSYEALGEALGCHRASFPRWKRAYPDAPKATASGKHSVSAWRDFFNAHPEIRGAGDMTVEAQLLELEDLRQKVRKAIHLNDVREGQYTRNEIAAARIGETVGRAKQLLRQKLEFELPGQIAHQPADEIRIAMKRVVDEFCTQLGKLADGWDF